MNEVKLIFSFFGIIVIVSIISITMALLNLDTLIPYVGGIAGVLLFISSIKRYLNDDV